MMGLDAILAALGLSKASVITGGAGAAAAALNGDRRPWWVRVVNFTIGFFVAAYGSGVAVVVFHLPDTATFNGALGFVLGYLGMTLMDAVLAATQALQGADWKDIAASWLKRKE